MIYSTIGVNCVKCLATFNLSHHGCSFLYSAERKSRLAEVERRWEEKKQSLTEELARVEKLLAGAYDRSAGVDHGIHTHTPPSPIPPYTHT